MDRRNSIIEPTGGYGPDTRNQLNTTTTLPKPQQRAPEFNQYRQPRPELYQQQPQQQQQQQQQQQSQQPQQHQQQGSFGGAPNRPTGQPQQQRAPPPQQQQQQQSRTPGDKVSPWNLIRQTLPPDVGFRGPAPQQRPSPPQYFNMQQQRPQQSQEQQQYRQQVPPPMQERRAPPTRPEDRAPYRPENGRQARPAGAGGGTGDDNDEVVVNSTAANQQPPPPPPPLNRRDSTVYGGASRPVDGQGDPNRQWSQRLGATQGPYVKPQPPPDQVAQYGRPTATIADGQEQQRNPLPAVNSYGRPQQDDDVRRPSAMPNGQKARDVQPLTRRDSVLQDATFNKAADVAGSRRNDVPATEYGRRPPLSDSQEDGGRRPPPELARRAYLASDMQEDGGKRPSLPAEHKKTEPEQTTGGRRLSEHRKDRPEAAPVGKEDKLSAKDHDQLQQQQQSRYERKVSLENELPGPKLGTESNASNRASELRKAHFDATHMKPVKEEKQLSRVMDHGVKTLSKVQLPRDVVNDRPKDYAAVLAGSTTAENESDSIYRSNKDEPPQSKNSRPDTLKIIKDNEPFKDSQNSKGNRNDDVSKSPSKIPKKDRSELLKTPTRAVTPKSPDLSIGQKKLPMNKVQVGSAPSPNLKVVRSKVGSLQNTSHKPGGGQVKIENRKLEWKAGTKIMAKNDTYVPGGGDKKIQSVKLQWNAKPKVGSLENKTHKPGGGDKKIETVKLDFKDKAKPKIGSKDNIKHTPGGGDIKIEDQKLEIKAQSKVGSLDNVKHRPGGGEVKIFDDKSYIKQSTGQNDIVGTPTKSQSSRSSQAGNVAEQEI